MPNNTSSTPPASPAEFAGLYTADAKRIALAKARQAAVMRGERPDRWPISVIASCHCRAIVITTPQQ